MNTLSDTNVDRVRRNPDFIELTRSRKSFGWTLTIIMLLIYYGYIYLVAYQKPLIAQPLIGAVTVGLVLGLGVIFSAIILTGVYVLRANGKFDELSRRIVANDTAGKVVGGTLVGSLGGAR
jgi:uncharacterized membrane protein (DUF485 family)